MSWTERDPGTRREALRSGLAISGGVAAITAVPLLARVDAALAQPGSDADLVTVTLALEQQAALAYGAIAERDFLEAEVRRAIELFAEQERQHVDALTAALEDLGEAAPEPPGPDAVEGLAEVASQEEALELAVELEDGLVRAYEDAAGRLQRTDLVLLGAQIVCNQAQHLVVLRQQLGEDPVPRALESHLP